MAGKKILVLGGTGPAGICLLRELVYRKHEIVVFARNPAKVPEDLLASAGDLIEVVQGGLTDLDALTPAIAKSHIIISLLGPTSFRLESDTLFADFYRSIFPLMRAHGVRRIFAMGTISIIHATDPSSISRWLLVLPVRLIAQGAYRNILALAAAFEDAEAAKDIDWTVFRIAGIPGGSDAAAWEADRREGEVYVGPVGGEGWTLMQKRAALARWLVDAAEGGADEWIGKMPAVTRLAGSKVRDA